MNRTDELRHYIDDCQAGTAFVAQELLPQLQPLLRETDQGCATSSSPPTAITWKRPTDLRVPDFISAARDFSAAPGVMPWTDALARPCSPAADGRPRRISPCVMPYTSGTTGAQGLRARTAA